MFAPPPSPLLHALRPTLSSIGNISQSSSTFRWCSFAAAAAFLSLRRESDMMTPISDPRTLPCHVRVIMSGTLTVGTIIY
jgi:hypothetical protein